MFTFNGKPVTQLIIARFWSRVDIGEPDECWEWQAGRNSKKPGYDYGVFWVNGRSVLAHRMAVSITVGRFVESEEVMHKCDNCPCCNPNHLFAGTHTDNMRDCVEKGRLRPTRGTAHPLSKLDDDKVRKIRRLHKLRQKYLRFTVTYLANKYGVDRSLIRMVINHKAWKHVEDD